MKLDHRYRHGNYYLVKERALKPLWRIDKDGLPLLLKCVTLNAYSGQQGSAVVPPAPVNLIVRFGTKQQLLGSRVYNIYAPISFFSSYLFQLLLVMGLI